jgi:Protein of unknown function (DUF2934)
MSRESEIATEHAIALSDMGKNTGRRLYPTHDEIAQLAFSLYESRGRQEGHQMEDWLRAEQELVRHYA